MSLGLQLYLDFVVFTLGAVAGSFLNVCVHRMPRDQSIVHPPSHCPACQGRILWRDNIPLVSYLLLGRKCRHCGAHITPRYFIVELITALLYLAVWLRFDDWRVPIYWILISGLIAATFIDFEHYIIPNEITLGGIVVGLIASVCYPPLLDAGTIGQGALRSVLGVLVGGGTLWLVVEGGKLLFGKRKVPLPAGTTIRIADHKLNVLDEVLSWEEIFSRESDRLIFRAHTLTMGEKTFSNAHVQVSERQIAVDGQYHDLEHAGAIEATTDMIVIPREAMGLGDVKLLAAIGAFLGWRAALFTVFASSVVGGVLGLALVLARHKDWQSRIPYGPYIALGALIWLFCGPEIVQWYLSLVKG
jgi:leader peptidase (prepilin peptidase)/N-methyltransferase